MPCSEQINKWTLVYCTLPCCYWSLILSDDGLNDWNTSSICHQLVKLTLNQFTDWITGARCCCDKWSVTRCGPTPLTTGHADEWLNRQKGALANQQTISLLNEYYANEVSWMHQNNHMKMMPGVTLGGGVWMYMHIRVSVTVHMGRNCK